MLSFSPPALSSFEGGWNGAAAHGVSHTVVHHVFLFDCDWLVVIGSSQEYVNGFLRLAASVVRNCVLEPRPVAGGGGDSWVMAS